MTEIARPRILNVDDTDAGRYAVSRILTHAGFEVMEATNGKDALELAAQGPDLILLDVNLPDMSGFEVCKRIKADPNTTLIPVVHLSATYVHSKDVVQGMEGGAEGYLTQPVEPQVLVATLRAHLRMRATEAALRESEDRYRDLVENSQDPICTHDLEGKLLSVNPAAKRYTGYSRAALLEMNLADLLTRGTLAVFPAYLAEIGAKGAAQGSMRIRTAAGETRWWEFNNTLRTEGVATPVVRGMARDVTEGKRSEKARRESEQRFRGLVEQSIAGIYIVQDGKFAYVNPRTAEIAGRGSAGDLIGTDVLQWIFEADRRTVAENIRRLLVGEAQNVALDFRALRGDGVTIHVGANAARATHEHRPAIIGLLQDISEKKRADEEILRYVARLKSAFMSTVEVATIISEMRDPYTAGHERRVAQIAAAIGADLGLDEQRQEGLTVAGHLHDVGKVSIPAEILSKPGKLSAIELQLVRGHAQAGYDVLKGVEFPWPVAEVALQHHERIDGSGYPQGLKDGAIILEARIMAVADVIEAMSSHRPYRPGLGIDKALAEIERGRGSAYDTDVADCCLHLFRETGFKITEF